MNQIYFDYNSTAPLDPFVRAAMVPVLVEIYGNPSSPHRIGQRARVLLDAAHERVAGVLGCGAGEVVFTSGGTEANNLAILGAARRRRGYGRHLITSAVEHHSVLNCFRYLAEQEGYSVTCLPVDSEGRVLVDSLREAIRPDTVLVSIMAANNETGVLQPASELGGICREHGILFHTDAVQWFGKERLTSIHQFNADLVTVCAHKFHGPKGAGALFIRSGVKLDPLLFGGSQENERRPGTENLAAITGLTEATCRFVLDPVFPLDQLRMLRQRVIRLLESIRDVLVLGERSERLSNTVAFSVAGCDSVTLVSGLDMEGICVSGGAACASGSMRTSHVLEAMKVPREFTRSLVRISMGRETGEADLIALEKVLPGVIERARSA